MNQRATVAGIAIAIIIGLSCPADSRGQDEQKNASAADLIRGAAKNANSKQKYQLAYKLKEGQTLRWSVEHTASTKTRMAEEEEKTSSRSQSVKVWTVENVDTIGNMTFEHMIESVSMWQQIGDMEPISFDSKTDDQAPEEYESVMEKIGKPLATITINSMGQVVDRKTSLKQARFGAGDIATPLPKSAIVVGHRWYVPGTLSATDEHGRKQQLKTRIHYQLTKVKQPNAYISFRTEVLTPIESDKVKSQIMQQMTKGYLVFDIDRGLPVRKEVEWDERVQGYEGPDSYLNYVGKLTEKLLVGEHAQATDTPVKVSQKRSQSNIKTRGSKPILRK